MHFALYGFWLLILACKVTIVDSDGLCLKHHDTVPIKNKAVLRGALNDSGISHYIALTFNVYDNATLYYIIIITVVFILLCFTEIKQNVLCSKTLRNADIFPYPTCYSTTLTSFPTELCVRH